MARRVIIAIDGPAGAGKSTIARAVADKLGFVYIDTGAMYRAVALWGMKLEIASNDAQKLEQLAIEADISFESGSRRVLLNGDDVTEEIRTPAVSTAASQVSSITGVRRALIEKQRQMGLDVNVVMEGRDIGTVVFPEATVKIFLDAAAAVRTGRRTMELQARGQAADANETHREIAERDQRDRMRAEAPLVQAPDAVYVDTTGLSLAEVEQAILKLIRDRTTNGKEYSH